MDCQSSSVIDDISVLKLDDGTIVTMRQAEGNLPTVDSQVFLEMNGPYVIYSE